MGGLAVNASPKEVGRARILDVSEDEYFDDPCPTPSLSKSIGHVLIRKSPAHAALLHPKMGAYKDESTRAQNDGSIIHKLLLGKGADVAVIDAADFRSKAAREDRDNALALGQIPIVAEKYAQLEAAARVIRQNIEALDGVGELTGVPEMAIEFLEDGNVGDVLCRCRLDLWQPDRARIVDIKKIANIEEKTITRQIFDYGYAMQDAAYTAAVEKLYPALAGRVEFLFLFVELEPPYSVVPKRLDGAFREIGDRQWKRAVALWEQCMLTGRWPPPARFITDAMPEPWMLVLEGL